MPNLYWSKSNGSILLGGSVQTGKDVLLHGQEYQGLPSTFSVYRRFGFLLTYYRRKKGKEPTKHLKPPLTANASGSGRAQAGPITLPSPGRRVKWRMFFKDDLGNESDELHVSRLGSVHPNLGLPPELGGARAKFDFRAAIDPLVEVSLITPWDDGSDGFEDYSRELAEAVADEGEDIEEVHSSLLEFLDRLLPQERPTGWEFALEPKEFEVDEGESVQINLSATTPTRGAVAFALQATAEVEGERVSAASEPMVLHVPEDGSQAALLLGDGGSSGGGSELEPADEGVIESVSSAEAVSAESLSRQPSPAG